MSDKYPVSLEQKLCFICLTAYDSGTLLFASPSQSALEKYTITGIEGRCRTCQQYQDDDFISLVGAIPHSDTATHVKNEEDFTRTGDIIHVKRKLYEDIFTVAIPKESVAMIDPEVVHLLRERFELDSPPKDESPIPEVLQ